MNKQPLIKKVILTVLLLICLVFAHSAYDAIKGPFESSIATLQAEDCAVTYSLSRLIATGQLLQIINLFFIILFFLIWIKPAISGGFFLFNQIKKGSYENNQ